MAGEDGVWIHEAIVRFLQGPCYSVPLMGFIDENCAIFDTEVRPPPSPPLPSPAPPLHPSSSSCPPLFPLPARSLSPTSSGPGAGDVGAAPGADFLDRAPRAPRPAQEEMRFEYTAIHNRFKALVDDLLTGYLEELGVSPETFMEVATKMGADKLNEFVVSSILTVDNFVQFRNMMVQRNIDLTHQALSQLEEEQAADAPEQPGTPERSATPEKLAPAPEAKAPPKASPAPAPEPAPEPEMKKASAAPPTPGKDADLEAALEASRKLDEENQRERRLEEEREAQELARALALSREEDETRKEVLEAEAEAIRASEEEAAAAAAAAVKASASSSSPATSGGAGSSGPAAAAASDSATATAAPETTESRERPAAETAHQEAAGAAAPPARPRMTELPPLRGPKGLHGGAGFSSSSGGAKEGGNGGLFKGRTNPLDPPPLVSDLSALREAAKAAAMAQKKFLSADVADTRKRMLAENKSKRDNHLQNYLDRGSAMRGMVYETAAYKSVTGGGAHAHAAEHDSKRAALRKELARQLKQDLLGGVRSAEA